VVSGCGNWWADLDLGATLVVVLLTLADLLFSFFFLPSFRFGMIKNHLHLAAYDGHDEVVKTLLKQSSNKKNINAKDKNGWAPLHCAAARGHLKVFVWLI
jgi:ankyrin repeat protein